jgi:2-polyprenyl-3-methyl-5-hydroxy-6-metoxy-1,4-benzoquinol methylase
VLDVGCSTGDMGAVLRARGHVVIGIEYEPALAERAKANLDGVIVGDVEALAREGFDPGAPFDCIAFADVLEHLRDPWSVVRWSEGLLAPDGLVVVSVPNIRHLETFWSLAFRKRWPYKDVGIFDRTHLRFFARANLPELFTGTALHITDVRRQFWLSPERGERFNRWAPRFGDLGTMQFIVTARR